MLDPKICRLCTTETPIYTSLLESKLSIMLEALTSINASANDTISTVVCLKCCLKLKLAYSIQRQMVTANEKLTKKLIKQNVISDETIKQESTCYNRCDVQVSCNDCIICGGSSVHLNEHIQKHFNREQKCETCNKSFCNIGSYRRHLIEHPQMRPHQCSQCKCVFLYKSLYYIHVEKVHKMKDITEPSLKQVTYTCDTCPKIFSCKTAYKKHKLNHGKKECPICHKMFAIGSIRQHILNHGDIPQICEICGNTLKNKACLRKHIQNSHSQLTFPCGKCGNIFKKKISRDFHQNSAHGKPTHICETCGKKFFSWNRLNIHIKMKHMKQRPYVCEFCSKNFSSKFALTTHRRQHTNETPYKCDVCGEAFRQNVSLRGHKKSKHKIVESNVVECKVCGKGFSSQWALKCHTAITSHEEIIK